MQAKRVAATNQGSTTNSDMPTAATSATTSFDQVQNISSSEQGGDKTTTTLTGQSAPRAPMSPAQPHGPMTNIASSNQANQQQNMHHHNQHQGQQHLHHHHQQQQQQHHHHHHHHHADQSNPGTGSFGHNHDARYGTYQSHANAPYYNQHNRHRQSHKGENESQANHVILITVINPHYPITCDLMHQICSPHGKVNRIVIFRKNGVQAMVEFDSIEPAKRAKAMLQGCDIYSGCCTLRVEFARPARLNVHKNDSDSFDYTGIEVGTSPGQTENSAHQQSAGQPLAQANTHLNRRRDHVKPNIPPLPANSIGGGSVGSGTSSQGTSYPVDQAIGSTTGANNNLDPPSGPDYVAVGEILSTSHCIDQATGPRQNLTDRSDHHHHNQHHHPQQQQHHHHHAHQHQSAAYQQQHQHERDFLPSGPRGTVMMVYGLNPHRFNCDRLFNLFCLYGNVVRVKFLRSKEGCAMVQMGDAMSVERCFYALHKLEIFGSELQISFSKQAFLHDVKQPFALPDGSPSFKDYTGNKNNRFKNPEAAEKNKLLPPSKNLHFFNAPHGISEEELLHLFKQTGDYRDISVQIFPPKTGVKVKSCSGLVMFSEPYEATEALVLCNHISLPKEGAPNPYILRLCFWPHIYCP